MSLLIVKAIIILDSNGNRIVSRYYPIDDDLETKEKQLAFEKALFSKTHRQNSEVANIDQYIAVYKSSMDTMFYVVGSYDENELILLSVLNLLLEILNNVLSDRVDKSSLLKNLDYVFLVLDELVDDGIILENMDAYAVQSRIISRSDDSDTPLSEQTLSQALKAAKEQLSKTILS